MPWGLQRWDVYTPAFPMVIRNDVAIDDAMRETFGILERFDLSPVRSKILKDGALPLMFADDAILEFRKYIGLYLNGGTSSSYTMFSEDVDEVWHTCILHTRLYRDFCDAILGRYLHHQPFLNGDPDASANWEHFEGAYSDLYGSISEIWYLRRLPASGGPALFQALQRWLHPNGRVRQAYGAPENSDGGCGCGS